MAGKKKQDDGAPAYMAQYTALMTIMLAFFITMQSMGANRVNKYKQEGVGFIRDAFGLKGGGLGLLSFMRTLMRHYPEVRKEKDKDEAELLGYEKGAFESEVFDAEGIYKIEILDVGYDVRILLPSVFENGGLYFRDDAGRMLGRLGGVLYGLTNHMITVCCYKTRAEDGGSSKVQAAKRASIITKYFSEHSGIPPERLNAVGCADGRYLEDGGKGLPDEAACLVIRRKNSKSRSTAF